MKIHHTAITVSSLEKSIEFYEEVFGLKVEIRFTKEDLGAKAVVMSDDEGNKIEIWEFKNSLALLDSQNNFSTQGIKHIGFESDDVQSMWNKLKDKYECTPITQGKTATYFFMKDPTGIPLEIYQAL